MRILAVSLLQNNRKREVLVKLAGRTRVAKSQVQLSLVLCCTYSDSIQPRFFRETWGNCTAWGDQGRRIQSVL
jgi:hypothetical protein